MKIKFIFLPFCFFLMKIALAQFSLSALSQADQKYNAFAYPEAIELYEYLVKKGDSSANVIRNLANSYRLTNHTEKAEHWYKYIVSKQKCNSNDVYNYVLLLRGNEKYDQADSILKKFEYKFRRDSRIERHKSQPHYIDSLKAKENDYHVKLLNINSAFQDLSPAFYKDRLVFVSSRNQKAGIKREYNWTNESFLDYYSFEIPKNAEEIENIKVIPFSKKLNSALHEGQLVFSRNGKEVYFTSNNINRSIKYKSSTGISQLMIYRAEWKDGDWENIKPMRFNVQEFSYAYPTLSANGKILYFSSDRSGGYGGADIYKVERKDVNSDWSGPINLGEKINTEGDELFPFMHLSGELYFSSNGHPGLGGLDVFKASNIDNQIKVENLGFGINGPKDDFGFILNERGDAGFFSSNREGGYGMDDIYGFTYSKAHFEKMNLVKLAGIVDSLYVIDVNDPAFIEDPGLLEELTDLGFVKDGYVKIRASDITEIEDEELREKLKKLGLFDSETLALMLEDDILHELEEKKRRLKKLAMIVDSVYTMDLSDSELLDDPELVAKLTEMGYLKDNVLTIKASEISELEDTQLKSKLSEIGLKSSEELTQEKNEAQKVESSIAENSRPDTIAFRKKLKKLDMIKDSLYTIELSEDDFLDDPGLYAELEGMGYIKDNVLKIKSSELKKLDTKIKERLAKTGLFDRKTLGLNELIETVAKEENNEKPEYFIFMGSIQEHNSNNKLKGVKIIIRNNDNGQKFIGKTDENGIFRDTVLGCKPNSLLSLFITIKKKGYISKSFSLEEKLGDYGVVNLDNFLKKIQMTKFDINVEIGSAANLNPIYFEYNSADITANAKIELDKLAEILVEEPRLLIELGSHTDSKGNDEYNLALSKRRAESTKNYVVSMGVEAFRIKAVGYGETKLKNHCANGVQCSDEEHAVNRRTEFRVIGLN